MPLQSTPQPALVVSATVDTIRDDLGASDGWVVAGHGPPGGDSGARSVIARRGLDRVRGPA